MRPRDRPFDYTLSLIAPAKQTRRLRITANCARRIVARAIQTRRYGFHFWKKIGCNRRYFCCKLPPTAPGGRTLFRFRQLYIYIDFKFFVSIKNFWMWYKIVFLLYFYCKKMIFLIGIWVFMKKNQWFWLNILLKS